MTELALDIDLRRGDAFRLRVAEQLALTSCTAVVGASGAGKTTLLRCVAGLEQPGREERLSIRVDGEIWDHGRTHLPTHRRPLGCVFQEVRLLPHLTVRGNLDYVLRRRPAGSHGLHALTEMLELGPLLDRRPGQLSRGQQQRAALARALAADVRLVLLDEPLASLDGEARARIVGDLQRVRDETGVALLLVSHSLEEVTRLASDALVLEEGRVRAHGPLAAVAADPRSAGVAESGPAAVLECTVAREDPGDGLTRLEFDGGALLTTGIAAVPGARIAVRIPAHEVALSLTCPTDSSILNILPARLEGLDARGEHAVLVRLRAGRTRLLARISRRSARNLGLAPGQPVYALVKSVALATANR